MNFRAFADTLSIGTGLALVAGCGGSQPLIAAPGAMPESRATASHVDRNGSWMDPQAKADNLLYISNEGLSTDGKNYVTVYSLQSGKLVGTLKGFPLLNSLCVDKAQDIYLVSSDANKGKVYEFAHGGTKPIKTLPQYHGDSVSCSVDPTTGNLAVAEYNHGIEIYTAASGIPKVYKDPALTYYSDPAYDNKGNLFVGGYKSSATVFAELAEGSSKLRSFTLSKPLVSGILQWDGKYLAVADAERTPNVIYQFSVSGSTGTLKSTTMLDDLDTGFSDFWAEKLGSAAANPQATMVVVVDYTLNYVAYWHYPAGGNPFKTITGGQSKPVGVTISKGKQ